MTVITTTNKQSSIVQHFNAEQLKVLKQQIAPKCSDTELDYFIEVCKQTNLSPFTREIYAISRDVWNAETQRKEPKMTIQVSIDGLRKRAANSGYYDGSSTFWCGSDGQWLEVWLKPTPPAAAKTIVYRKGCSQPFTAVARFDAYKQDFKGKLSGLWEKMPDIMIGKCSEALALRKAFPEQTAGLYASEEMDQADNEKPIYQPLATELDPPQPQSIEPFWEPKLFDRFLEFASKVDSFEKLESLEQWVKRQPKPSEKQSAKIAKILTGFKFDSQPVKSAQVTDDLGENLEADLSSQSIQELNGDIPFQLLTHTHGGALRRFNIMNELLKQLCDRYESENGFAQNYRDLNVETLEEIILDFQNLYQFGDSDMETNAFIHSDDWTAFSHWEPCDQSEFLAYLAAKIAVARN